MLNRNLVILGLVGFVTCGVLGLAGSALIFQRQAATAKQFEEKKHA